MARPFLIQGHRGARGLRPENTLPSFEYAIDSGVGSIECDVHLTADGVPVLVHDPILPIESQPLVHRLTAKQLCGVLVDRIPDSARFPDQLPTRMPLATALRGETQYAIPTLADLYGFVAAYAGEPGRTAGKTDAQRTNATAIIVDVEIKLVPFIPELAEAGAMERAVLEVIQEFDAVGRTWVRSFDHRCVRRLRQTEPRLTGVVLVEATTPVDPASLVRSADAQVYAPDYRFLDEDQVRRCQSAGYQVVPWTVNAPDDWARLIEWRVDGITTDYPDRLASWLAQPPASAK
jgi:glycerophosphoryl diester phosphodiesterase